MSKFREYGIGALFYVGAAFLIVLALLLIYHANDDEKAYEKLEEQYFELESKYEETSRTLDNVYDDISDTMDSMFLLYDYFEEQSITFDEAYEAYDTLSCIIHPYY